MKATKLALFVLAVGFFASCGGGEKKAETPAVDTTVVAPAMDTTAAAPAVDTTAAAPAVDTTAAAPAAH